MKRPNDVGGSPPRDHRQSAPRPPSHLSPAARSFWRGIAQQRPPLTPDRLRLLTMCAETLDTYERARVEIRKHGMTVKTRTGYIRPHPAVQQQVDARRDFLKLLAALDETVAPAANPAHSADLVSFPDDAMSEV